MVNTLEFLKRVEAFTKNLEDLKKTIKEYSSRTFVFKNFSTLKIK